MVGWCGPVLGQARLMDGDVYLNHPDGGVHHQSELVPILVTSKEQGGNMGDSNSIKITEPPEGREQACNTHRSNTSLVRQ